MGLILDQVVKSGFTASYWKVIKCNVDFVRLSAEVTLALYKDQESADAGDEPIDYQSFIFSDQDFPFKEVKDPLSNIYTSVKALPKFTGAQDVIEAAPIGP